MWVGAIRLFISPNFSIQSDDKMSLTKEAQSAWTVDDDSSERSFTDDSDDPDSNDDFFDHDEEVASYNNKRQCMLE